MGKDDDSHGALEPGERFGDCTVERLLGKGSAGTVYLVRAPGGSVKDRLREKGAMPITDAISVATQIADALGMAHFHGARRRGRHHDLHVRGCGIIRRQQRIGRT